MARDRRVVRFQSAVEGVPFSSAEEAWLWYARCQIARDEGVRYTAGLADIPRPCEPDDIAREVGRLHRGRRLRPGHLRVLGRFGGRLTAPDPQGDATPGEAALWDEAMDRLTTPLRHKGIVA
ncbi:hypothetical protein [Magnetospirillum sp. SS-4]|uniref:hypothetical protein n=1 Tax=Magnetospirillum sp. SS-4 TaxID=2681465 RepID=UPI0013862BDF|nr:hypothetical protein [Magnetospirillum sp. SS-4]CAA7627412.1 conserved hypothetical protein [Magnetospirillum sp. SS-4]